VTDCLEVLKMRACSDLLNKNRIIGRRLECREWV
jgi:hypothetical protein